MSNLTQQPLLTNQQTAEALQVSVQTINRMRKRKEINGIRVGRQWRFLSGEIEAYLGRQLASASLSGKVVGQ